MYGCAEYGLPGLANKLDLCFFSDCLHARCLTLLNSSMRHEQCTALGKPSGLRTRSARSAYSGSSGENRQSGTQGTLRQDSRASPGPRGVAFARDRASRQCSVALVPGTAPRGVPVAQGHRITRGSIDGRDRRGLPRLAHPASAADVLPEENLVNRLFYATKVAGRVTESLKTNAYQDPAQLVIPRSDLISLGLPHCTVGHISPMSIIWFQSNLRVCTSCIETVQHARSNNQDESSGWEILHPGLPIPELAVPRCSSQFPFRKWWSYSGTPKFMRLQA